MAEEDKRNSLFFHYPIRKNLLKTISALFLIGIILPPLPAPAQVVVTQNFFTTSDQVKLNYLEAGRGQAVLFIPGWLMPAEIWEPQFREFSKDFHVIALDPRSQGQSDMTHKGNNPLRRSQDILELLEHLEIKSVVLVGWALGAYDSLAFLRQFDGEKLKALVLVDSPLGAASTPPTQRGPFLQLFQTDRLNANQNYVWGLFKKQPTSGFTRRMIQSAARVPTDIALATLDNTQPGEPWQPTLRGFRSTPLLYAITPKYASQAQWLVEIAPQARVETFENSGHALFVDEADRFNGVLRNFIHQASLYPPGFSTSSNREPNLPPAALVAEATLTPSGTSTPSKPFSFFSFLSKPSATPYPSTPILTTLPAVPTSTPGLTETTLPTEVPARTLITPTGPSPTATPTPIPDNSPTSTYTPIPVPSPTAVPANNPSPVVSATKAPVEKQFFLSPAAIQDGYFTTSDHVRLHYLEAGQGQSLVFIPGWLIPAEIWTPQFQGLSQDFHVVALDPRCQGLSEITSQGNDPLRQSRDIQELLDHLHLSSVVLVGWSHGGFQVLAYLGQFGPDRLYAAVLVDSALGAASSSPGNGTTRTRFLENFKRDKTATTRGFVWGLFKKSPPLEFFHRIAAAADRVPIPMALALMNNYFPGENYQPSMPTIKQIPLLYAVTPKYTSQAEYLLSVDPQARVEVFKGTGHALFVDDAAHFNDTLRGFLRHAGTYPGGWPHAAPKAGATPNYR